nr:4'-phosphopantetheinyl transferase superfamily protein [uncultured Rhodopila sp.]
MTLRTAGLAMAQVTRWLPLLGADDTARAARFVFERDRVTFIAAHALLNTVVAAALGVAPAALQFVRGPHGKPDVRVAGLPAPISFNLSHTDGLIGLALAAAPGCALGFDLERLDRGTKIDVARSYFHPEECAWLLALPVEEQPAGFVRLWTLKEAFIKATGEGLSRDLASFLFRPVVPPRIAFAHQSPAVAAGEWWFEQRIIDSVFMAAVGLHTAGGHATITWREADAGSLMTG